MAPHDPEAPDADPVTESQVEAVAAGEADPAAADETAAIDATAPVEDIRGPSTNGHDAAETDAAETEAAAPADAPAIDESGASAGFEVRDEAEATRDEAEPARDATEPELEPSADPVPATPEATREPLTPPNEPVAATTEPVTSSTPRVEATDAAAEDDSLHEPAPSTGPRTVGRFIADALRAAGVRHAFTVPGESFIGLLDGL